MNSASHTSDIFIYLTTTTTATEPTYKNPTSSWRTKRFRLWPQTKRPATTTGLLSWINLSRYPRVIAMRLQMMHLKQKTNWTWALLAWRSENGCASLILKSKISRSSRLHTRSGGNGWGAKGFRPCYVNYLWLCIWGECDAGIWFDTLDGWCCDMAKWLYFLQLKCA